MGHSVPQRRGGFTTEGTEGRSGGDWDKGSLGYLFSIDEMDVPTPIDSRLNV